jgi:Cu(I)/Ag(I) efflux system membrane fusion protein
MPTIATFAQLVPKGFVSAPYRSTEATVVMVAEGTGGEQRFRAVEVEVGEESGGRTEIRKGLQPGARVVASGQFLIDSESSLKAGTARLGEPGSKP